MKQIYSLFTSLFFLVGSFSRAQELGCTDPLANNYNASATYGDGSCTYNSSSISLNNTQNLPASLNEISGMVYWNGKIYGHQDSGGPNVLYEVNPNTATITKTITIEGATNIDRGGR